MRSRRFGAVRHLADLFDRYAVHRPSMIEAWVAGDDTDGLGDALPPDVAWQATLWRHLRDRLAVPSPAERLTAGCARLRDDPDLSDLPPRLSLFGLTRLPASHVEVLDALATARDVHLFLLHPSPELWIRISAQATTRSLVPRADDPTAGLPRNPLLATWGRDSREMQLVLGARGTDVHHAAAAATGSLLQRIQAGVRADAAPPGPPLRDEADQRLLLDPSDDSLRVHSCHGRTRQVEVLRDAILHLLADDPTLEPRDVIVMCPDIETFAPLIQATFGAVERDEPASPASGLPDLRVRLADRSLRQTNPVLGAVSELLTLVDARITASQLLDFASREPVRRMFRLDDDDLARLEEWIAATGIRWGLDAAHRAPYQLDALAENTWRTGLDRLLLGVTMAEDDLRLVGDVLPLDDVDSGDIELAGRFAELVDRIQTAVDELSPPKPIEAWVEAIASAAGTLTATSDRDAWQRAELDRILGDVITEAAAGTAVDLSLVEVRALLADRLRGRPTRANFRTGHLTICTLVPMRSVPHRVVCLLGLDDGVFPRRTAPDGDDIIERAPCVGDRDPRSEDRQLLLDALTRRHRSSRDHVQRPRRADQRRPPAGRAPRRAPRRRGRHCPCRERLRPRPGLRPPPAAAVRPAQLRLRTRWSPANRGASTPSLSTAPAPRSPVPLRRLRSCRGRWRPSTTHWWSSTTSFGSSGTRSRPSCASASRSRSATVDDEPADSLPVALDSLERWNVGDRILELRLAGFDEDTCVDAEVARGGLPPGTLGDVELDGLLPVIDHIYEVAMDAVDAAATTESVEVERRPRRRPRRSSAPCRASSASVGARRHVLPRRAQAPPRRVGAAAGADRGASRSLVHRRDHRAGQARARRRGPHRSRRRGRRAGPTADPRRPARQGHAGAAAALLRDVGRLRRGPTCDPRQEGARRVDHLARRDFRRRTGTASTCSCSADNVPFDDLLLAAPNADEAGAGWPADETTRFGRYARRLWDGLLAHEELENL